MLKINGSAMDNHPHPPLYCTAVADRIVQLLTLVLIKMNGTHGLVKEDSCSLTKTDHPHVITHTDKYTRHVNEAHQAVLCRNHESRLFTMKEAHTL